MTDGSEYRRAAMIADRDRRSGTKRAEKRRQRGNIPSPAVAKEADAWQKGRTIQLANPGANAHTPAQPNK